MQLNFEIYKHTRFYKKLNQLKEPFLNDLKKCFLGSKCIPKNITLMTQNQSLQYPLARLRGIEAASILFVVTNFSEDVGDEISNYSQNSLNTKFNEQEALKLALETLIK